MVGSSRGRRPRHQPEQFRRGTWLVPGEGIARATMQLAAGRQHARRAAPNDDREGPAAPPGKC